MWSNEKLQRFPSSFTHSKRHRSSSCWRKFAFINEREIIFKSFPCICRQEENFLFGIFHHLFLIFHADIFARVSRDTQRRKVINFIVFFILCVQTRFSARFMRISEMLVKFLLFDYCRWLSLAKLVTFAPDIAVRWFMFAVFIISSVLKILIHFLLEMLSMNIRLLQLRNQW